MSLVEMLIRVEQKSNNHHTEVVSLPETTSKAHFEIPGFDNRGRLPEALEKRNQSECGSTAQFGKSPLFRKQPSAFS